MIFMNMGPPLHPQLPGLIPPGLLLHVVLGTPLAGITARPPKAENRASAAAGQAADGHQDQKGNYQEGDWPDIDLGIAIDNHHYPCGPF